MQIIGNKVKKNMYYKGYILMRLKQIGKEWEIANLLKGMESSEPGDDWKIDYASPIYGPWDVIVECSFTKLQDLDKVVTYCRVNMSDLIEETTTLTGTKPDFVR